MEIKKDIERDIRVKTGQFVQSNPDVTFNFEFDGKRELFLISYSFLEMPDDNDPIWDTIFSLQSFFDEKYGDEAPLFCENERLFKLSSHHITVKIDTVYTGEINQEEKKTGYWFSADDLMDKFIGDVDEYSYAA